MQHALVLESVVFLINQKGRQGHARVLNRKDRLLEVALSVDTTRNVERRDRTQRQEMEQLLLQ